jgi:hypothetical protein
MSLPPGGGRAEEVKMKTTTTRILAVALLALLGTLGAAAADQQMFDLKVALGLSPEMRAQLTASDTLQVILRPEVQYGVRQVAGEPIVLERKYEPGMPDQNLRFTKALQPDQIYRLEMRIVRAGDPQHPIDVRYVSALDKMPRRPVEKEIRMRLFLGDRRDARDNHVMVVKDQDGIYRVMVFTA